MIKMVDCSCNHFWNFAVTCLRYRWLGRPPFSQIVTVLGWRQDRGSNPSPAICL